MNPKVEVKNAAKTMCINFELPSINYGGQYPKVEGECPFLDQHGWNYCVDICEIFGQCQTNALKFHLD